MDLVMEDVVEEARDGSSVAITVVVVDGAWGHQEEALHDEVEVDTVGNIKTTTNTMDQNSHAVCLRDAVLDVVAIHAVEHRTLEDQETMLELEATTTPSKTPPPKAPHK